MTRTPISLFDATSNSLVDAILLDPVDAAQVEAVGKQWSQIRQDHAQRQPKGATHGAEHGHWDWTKKAKKTQLLAYRCLAIECRGEIQGLMLLELAARHAKLDPDKGKPLVYVDYVEAAPWNLRQFTDKPKYKLVGSLLVEAAVQTSIAESFGGRLGLHSLPQSEDFYQRKCNMTRIGPDPSVQNLCYFEFTRESASQYIK